MDIQVTKHVADDKNGKYQVMLEGKVAGLATDLVDIKVILTADDESLLKKFPRPEVFTLTLKKSGQSAL